MHVTIRQLQIFAEVARQGSMLGAADTLALTPPAVSLQIKELENQVGLPLLDRTVRRLALTTAGEHFLFYARKMLATLKEAEDAMARFERLESGRLIIGMVSAAKYFLPQLLARFHTEHPAVEVRLRLGRRDTLGAMLQAREVDLCIMGRPPRDVPCRMEPFAMHPHVLVTAPNHRFAHAEEVPAAALADELFIMREADSGTHAILQDYLEEYRIQPRFVMEMPSNEGIKQAVMAGMGVSLLSLHTLALELQMGLIAVPHVQGLPRVRRWNLVFAQTPLAPAAEAFRYFMLEQAEAYLAGMFAATQGGAPARVAPLGGEASGNKASGGDASGGAAPSGEGPRDDNPRDDAPSDEAPSDEALTGEAPTAGAPSDEVTSDEVTSAEPTRAEPARRNRRAAGASKSSR